MRATQIGDSVRASAISACQGHPGISYVGIIADTKLSGETITAPHVRTAPFRSEQMSTLIGGATRGRGSTGSIARGDIFFIPDAGKHGLTRAGGTMEKCFKDEEGKKVKHVGKSYFVLHVQRSLMSRRRATRTCTSLHQMEMMMAFSSSTPQLPRRKRLLYDTVAITNEADTIGPVAFPLWSSSWAQSFGKKKELFMVENRIAVGGLTDPDEDTVADADETEDGDHADDGLGDSIVEDTMPGISGLTVNPGRASKHKREDGNLEVNVDDNNNN